MRCIVTTNKDSYYFYVHCRPAFLCDGVTLVVAAFIITLNTRTTVIITITMTIFNEVITEDCSRQLVERRK